MTLPVALVIPSPNPSGRTQVHQGMNIIPHSIGGRPPGALITVPEVPRLPRSKVTVVAVIVIIIIVIIIVGIIIVVRVRITFKYVNNIIPDV